MSTRSIIVFSTLQSVPATVQINAENRAELLTELAQKGYVTTNMKVFIKELNSELTSNTDALPTGLGKDQDGAVTHDFTVFLSAIKTKSGK